MAWTVGRGANTVPPIQSIAVLPVQNATGDPRQDYVSDGLTEALISGLAQVHALDVTARSSAMRFKGATQPAADISRQLDVDALVRSSVRRDGKMVRLNAEISGPRVRLRGGASSPARPTICLRWWLR